MPRFSQESKSILLTCHNDLQYLCNDVINFWDCKILDGRRTDERQRKNVEIGVSKTMESKHLYDPSLAVDVAPYPLEWPVKPRDDSPAELKRWMKEYALFYYFSGFVLGRALHLGINIRHGGDWDGDRNIKEQDFDDLVHFELVT